MKILITALGSMSANAVIDALRRESHTVIGCDIYPAHWLYCSQRVDAFIQVPRATDAEAYIESINAICGDHDIDLIIPLTDVEVDVLSLHRTRLRSPSALTLMDAESIAIARDKFAWNQRFAGNDIFLPLPSILLADYRPQALGFPVILKRRDGRSSEGLRRIETEVELLELSARLNGDDWIVQPFLAGEVHVIDIVRQQETGAWAGIARKELLRTANGAGLTVEILPDDALVAKAAAVARLLDLNGCINIEFMRHETGDYLMDINPRFSAGVEFSVMAGYDMIINHIHCFTRQPIQPSVAVQNAVFTRHYVAEKSITG
ncbi:carbamoyl phosphate synthase-like protein [Cedecea davisae]|uniref:ATP-grasp domain protein n=1 Tax=Cedecea davisae DSM 4568 TaxID=566551 RepID=S3J8G4_9ENTR|nr:ATP-grasp domain-containing protein [Cedecea davisae]EPF16372.1 ATP-grasp domain protein [Cedecea davisae DSM 4568]SUX38852.1 carbamoyl phosphate synthase-like protein [Cedecea davisae]